jgi:hypothetical protein
MGREGKRKGGEGKDDERRERDISTVISKKCKFFFVFLS